MMRICPTCRKEFQDDYRFCAECGARLEEKPEKPQGDADVVIRRGSIGPGMQDHCWERDVSRAGMTTAMPPVRIASA
jgi:hypothetical protein